NTITSWIRRASAPPAEKTGAEKRVQKNAPQRRRGAPAGNTNAVGNSGGAPLGNVNALVHGGYSAIYMDTLTEEERALLSAPEHDTERLLLEEIDLLSVRERRIMVRIRKLNLLEEKSPGGMGQAVAAVIRTEEKREFDSPEDIELYAEVQRAKVEGGKALPGHKYTLTTRTEPTYDVIHRLEDALTRCQAQKQRCIRNLMELRRDQADSETEIEDLTEAETVIYGNDSDSTDSGNAG
ncbi:MAG: hypothetical protein IJT94_17350, partial [Oscillibacter sp.]|nr:hypothetical protein [Oscillibacter sp.]